MGEANVFRKQTEINRDEWIAYEWIDATWMVSAERVYVRGRERPIEDAAEAALQFDTWIGATRMIWAREKRNG